MKTKTEDLPAFERREDIEKWLNNNFFKDGHWQKKKIKDYWNNLNGFDQVVFRDYAETTFRETKKGGDLRRTINKIEFPQKKEQTIPIQMEKDEFNLIIDCFAYLKEKGKISPKYRELAFALGKVFHAGYTEATIEEKLRRKDPYGEIIQDIINI